MALSSEDKLLGEKMHYYCSSSEDEGEEEDETKYGGYKGEPQAEAQPEIAAPEIGDYKGYCTNTGPKGVINDWRRFKQLENEKKAEQEAERLQLGKRLTLTTRTEEEDRLNQKADEEFLEHLQELEEFEDEFMKEYREKRLEEMRRMFSSLPKFGKVVALNKEGFIEAIDKENPAVTIVIHVYEDNVKACQAMNGCLTCLAQEYPAVKFCRIKASDAKLSYKFAVTGVPALLIYKKGEMIGNFIRVSDELGDDFFANDVESFLHEHCLLPEQGFASSVVKHSNLANTQDSDSDFDID